MQAEYKEFLALGHGDIFEMEVLKAVAVDRYGTPLQPPWMMPGTDLSDFFNYDMDVDTWRFYCAAISAYKCVAHLCCRVAACMAHVDRCDRTRSSCKCYTRVRKCCTSCTGTDVVWSMLPTCRKRYTLLSSAADAAGQPVLDEDELALPLAQQAGVAHPIAEYLPHDDPFLMPNGMRRMREPTVRNKKDVAAVTEVLAECDFANLPQEQQTGPPIDYGSWRMFSELGMVGITDFPHYHFNPEEEGLRMHPASKRICTVACISCLLLAHSQCATVCSHSTRVPVHERVLTLV